MAQIPFLGSGLSYHEEQRNEILAEAAHIDVLELIADQYIDMPPHKKEEACFLAGRFPVVLHSVDLSIGTDTPVDGEYLRKLHKVAEWVQPKWVSDHLCFTRVDGLNIGQLTPLSFSGQIADIVIRNIKCVAATFSCPFLLENISYYFTVPPGTMSEAEFITRIIRESGCGLLLDLTNVQNNAVNNDYNAYEFLDQIPLDRVVQVHLAGGYYHRGILLDAHSDPVPAEVFDLLRYSAPRMPLLRAVTIERDQNYPPFRELIDELDKIREILNTNWMPYHSRLYV